MGDVPVFYWPTLNMNLDQPHYYIDSFRFRHDSIFGYQTLFKFDAFQLLGMQAPAGVKWDLNLDYMSERGLGYGTGAEYARDTFFSLQGPTTGRADAWFISDHGHDNLGRDRRDIVPEAKFRGGMCSETTANTSLAGCLTTGSCRAKSVGSATARPRRVLRKRVGQ